MWNIYIFLFMIFFKKAYSYINNHLLNNVQPFKMRKNLHEKLNENYKYLSYSQAKTIMHTEINQIDIYGDNNSTKNVEHIFPQYLFKNDANKNMMKSDLHNLYLCNSKLNTLRQNFKYISHEDYIDNCNDHIVDQQGNNVEAKDIFKKQGYIMLINKKNKKFIPTPYSRGMISRSLAYFSIKYNYIEQLKQVIDIKTLLEWNLKDPVTNEEYYKNIITYKYQNNYNPFIIDPDLMLFSFSDMTNIDDLLLQKKKISGIDPLYSTEMLIKKIKQLEDNKIVLEREYKKIKNKIEKKKK